MNESFLMQHGRFMSNLWELGRGWLMLSSKWYNGRRGGEAGRLLRELSVKG